MAKIWEGNVRALIREDFQRMLQDALAAVQATGPKLESVAAVAGVGNVVSLIKG